MINSISTVFQQLFVFVWPSTTRYVLILFLNMFLWLLYAQPAGNVFRSPTIRPISLNYCLSLISSYSTVVCCCQPVAYLLIFSRITPLHRYTMMGLVPPPTGLPPSPMTCPFATSRYATVANRRYTVEPPSGVRIIDVATLRQCHGVRTSNDMLQCWISYWNENILCGSESDCGDCVLVS